MSAGTTYRRLIPDSGCADERERVLSSGEGEGLGVTVSSSVSSLQNTIIQRLAVVTDCFLLRLKYLCLRVPLVISQLLLQQEDFGLKLVPLVEDVP